MPSYQKEIKTIISGRELYRSQNLDRNTEATQSNFDNITTYKKEDYSETVYSLKEKDRSMSSFNNKPKSTSKKTDNQDISKKYPEKDIEWTGYLTMDDVFGKKEKGKRKEMWDPSELNKEPLGGWGKPHYYNTSPDNNEN